MSKKIRLFLLSCALMVMCCMGITAGASDNAQAEVVGHNLTITNEGISVSFYVDIAGVAQDSSIDVTLNGRKTTKPLSEFSTKEIIIDAKAYNCYVFTQPVAAKRMAEEVSLSIVSGDKELVKDDYCVNDYVTDVRTGGYGYNFENLANAMSYYGEFAKVYFGYNGATTVSEDATKYIENVKVDNFDGYGMTVEDTVLKKKGLTYYGAQLNLQSEITLRLCFTVSEEYEASNFTAVYGNSETSLELKKVGEYHCLDIEGVGADALGRGYTIKCGDEVIISNCSVLTYARAVVRAYSDKEDATNKQKSLLNVSKALYLYNQKALTYVDEPNSGIFDLFYNGSGFYAEPNCTNKVYLTANEEVTTVSTGNAEIQKLSQLNGKRTKGISVWMMEAYEPLEGEILSGPYAIRRYVSSGNVLNIEGTATLQAKIDGSCGEFVARYSDNTQPNGFEKEPVTITSSEGSVTSATSMVNVSENATFTIGQGGIIQNSHVPNGEVYVSGTLKVAGNAKSGVVTTCDENVTVIADGLNEYGKVKFPNHTSQKLSGTGEASAIDLVDSGDGHFGAIETTKATEGALPNLTLGSIICVCGDNVSEDPEHSCPWTEAQEDGLQAAYNILWEPVEKTATTLPIENGSYYLTGHLTGITRSEITNGNKVNLDLAGFTAQGPGYKGDGRIYRVKKGTLNIADSSPNQTGTIKSEGGTAPNGLAVYVWGTDAYSYGNIFGGTFEVSGNVVDTGATVGVATGCLNVYDGTIKGKVLVYSANASLNIFDDAQVGIKNEEQAEQSYGIATAYTIEAPHVITCTNVTGQESIVLKNLEDLNITGTGRASAVKFLEDGAGHFGVYETTVATEESLPTLNVGSIICGCGANISQDPNHSCGWVTAQGEAGIQAAYDLEWTAWTTEGSLPTSGSYYLTDDINGVNARTNINNGNIVNLDLAGNTIEGRGHQDAEGADPSGTVGLIYRVQKGTLNIADSSEDQTGAIYMSGETNDVGAMAVWAGDTSHMNIFGGTISAKIGTAVTIRIGHINMYGGTILPGEKPESYANANAVQIGTNQNNQTYDLNVFGGIIKGEVLISKSGATVDITKAAKVGIKDEKQPERPYGIKTTSALAGLTTINCAGITDKATVVLENLADISITGKGDASAIEFIEDGAGHFGAYETEEGLKVGSIICGCGDNISQAPNHSCGWVTAQGEVGIQAAYDLNWTALKSGDSLPTSGSYYLEDEEMNVSASRKDLGNGDVVNLDLAGNKIIGSGDKGIIYRINEATLNIADSQGGGAIELAGNTATYGALYVWGRDSDDTYLNIFGGTISATKGSAVTVARGTMNMYDGTILPGTADSDWTFTTANGVQLGVNTTARANLNLLGGTIKGEVLLGNNINDEGNILAQITVSDDAQVGVYAGTDETGDVIPYGIGTTEKITTTQTINFSDTSGEIVLKDTNYLALAENATGDASKFTIIDKHNKVVNVNGSSTLGYEAQMCVCGKVGEHAQDGCSVPTSPWQAWKSTTSLPKTKGSHYLIADVGVTVTENQITGGANVNLDLAGKTVTGAETTKFLYRLHNGTLNITDSSKEKTGTMKAIGDMDTQPGRVIYVWGASVNNGAYSYANIFGGTFDASEATGGYGTAVTISNGAMNMYDGTILAGSVVKEHANSVEIGIAAGTDSILNVEGGTIYGEVLLGNNTATLTISDNAKVGIKDDNQPLYGIGTTSLVTSAKTITCDNVIVDESVVIKNLDKVGVTGTGEASAFTLLEASRNTIIDDDGTLGYKAYMCVCGKMDGDYTHTDDCTGKAPDSPWLPWTSTTGLPTSGSYYLTQDLTNITTMQIIDSGTANLDLAGYKVMSAPTTSKYEGMFYRVNGTLNIADSSSDKNGGIYLTGADKNIYGSIAVWNDNSACINIFGGTFGANIGNPVTLRRGHLNMYGGTILPGTKIENYGGLGFTGANAVQVGITNNNLTDLNVSGGTIKGEVLISDTKNVTITVSDDAQVGIEAGNDESGNVILYGIGTTEKITTTQTINFSDTSGEIVLKDTNYLALAEGATGDASKITIIDQHNEVVNVDENGTLSIVAQMCVCGAVGEHTKVGDCAVPTSAWLPWNATISNATYGKVQFPTQSKSFYLTEDLSGDNAIVAQTSLTTQRLSIDLAGHTVDGSDTAQRIFAMNDGSKATLNITDSVGGGVLKNAQQTEADVYDGKVIRLYSTDATVNLYAGILTAEGTNIAGETNNNACTISISSGTFNMYGGTVVDNGGEDEDVFRAFNNHSKYNYVDGIVIEDGLCKRGDTTNTFRAGYGKKNINPEIGVSLGSFGDEDYRKTTGILTDSDGTVSDLEAVAIAVTDAENNTLILVVTDLSWGRISDANIIRDKVCRKYGIPKENVLVGGTHNHSAPSAKWTSDANKAYMEQWKENVMAAIDLAIRDRAEATMEVGRTETVDMVFSRRYLTKDGTCMGGGGEFTLEDFKKAVKHESEADEEIQMLRFVRDENKKDILITQWQSHACNVNGGSSEGEDHLKASGEWPQVIRRTLENELGVHCMYMQGAAANLGCMSRIPGENLYNATTEGDSIGYSDYVAIGEEVASYVSTAYNAENVFTEVDAGLIQINQYKMPVNLREKTDDDGNIIQLAGPAEEANYPELNTVAIGDVSLVTLPSELFDTSAKEIKDTVKNNNLFEMTLIMGYTCGSAGYEAPNEFWDHGCYEVTNGNYVRGTADDMVKHYIEKLTELFEAK